MKSLFKKVAGLLAVVPMLALAFSVVAPVGVFAENADLTLSGAMNVSQGENQPKELVGEGSIVTTVINVLLFIVGIASVIMIIYSGIRYTTSGGNSNSVTAAKNTLIYSIVGLVVAIIAYALVNWVFGSVSGAE